MMDSVKVKDAGGREIEVRKLKVLDNMRLLALIGSDNSSNDRYLAFASLAYSVVSIDGTALPRPNNLAGLEGLVQKLDDDGFSAIAKAHQDNFLAEAQTAEEAKDAVKN
jgi:hypothetical protein